MLAFCFSIQHCKDLWRSRSTLWDAWWFITLFNLQYLSNPVSVHRLISSSQMLAAIYFRKLIWTTLEIYLHAPAVSYLSRSVSAVQLLPSTPLLYTIVTAMTMKLFYFVPRNIDRLRFWFNLEAALLIINYFLFIWLLIFSFKIRIHVNLKAGQFSWLFRKRHLDNLLFRYTTLFWLYNSKNGFGWLRIGLFYPRR